MDFDVLFRCGIMEGILKHFGWKELLGLELVSKKFSEYINVDAVWRQAANDLFSGKRGVLSACARMAKQGATREHRGDLLDMSAKQLKELCKVYALDTKLCVEKIEFVRLVAAHEEKFIRARECLARYALRVAFCDRKRNMIHMSELVAQNWELRIRADGPLAHLIEADPWHNGLPASQVEFDRERKVVKFLNGPFRHMTDAGELGFTLDRNLGRFVGLSIGVREFVVRHPVHWGFMLVSTATIWTCFPMPRDDEFVTEENVERLVTFDEGMHFFAKTT